MKREIKIVSLELKNFKGCSNAKYQFLGQSANVFGDNMTGKTTIYDAFSWLMFGKNHDGVTNFEVKPTGADRPEVTVIGVMEVDGKNVELQKTLEESWTKKRGDDTETFTGHTTNYWVNKIPKKAGEYSAYVDSIVSESVFKRLTNAEYFLQMKKPEMRSVLIDMAGNVSESDVAGDDKGQQELVTLMNENGYSIDDLLKLTKQNVSMYNAEQKGIAPRIDEVKMNIPEQVEDYSELEKGLAKGIEYLTTIEKDLSKNRERAEAQADLYSQLSKVKVEMERYRDAKLKELNDDRESTLENRSRLNAELGTLNAKKETAEQKVYSAEDQIKSINRKMQELKENYIELDADKNELMAGEYKELGVDDINCEYCGQTLPENKIDELNKTNKEKYDARVKTKLESIQSDIDSVVKDGHEYKAKRTLIELQLKDAKEELDAVVADINSKKSRLKAIDEKVTGMNEVTEIDLSEDERYTQLESELDRLSKETQKDIGQEVNKLLDDRAKVQDQVDKIRELLSTRTAKEKAETRIAQLVARGKELAQLIAHEKKIQNSCEKFIRRKAELLQDGINSMFENLEFRLFVEQINGGINDDCTPMIKHNGKEPVEYKDASHSEQIRANMDIVNAMQKTEDIFCPVFVDNAEATTSLRKMECQVIALFVSEQDKKIRVQTAGVENPKTSEPGKEEKRVSEDQTEQDLFNFDFN